MPVTIFYSPICAKIGYLVGPQKNRPHLKIFLETLCKQCKTEKKNANWYTKRQYFYSVIYASNARCKFIYPTDAGRAKRPPSDDCYNSFWINIQRLRIMRIKTYIAVRALICTAALQTSAVAIRKRSFTIPKILSA